MTLLAMVGCDSDEPNNDVADALEAEANADPLGDVEYGFLEIDATPDDEPEIEAPRAPALLARVERRTSSVEWRDSGNDNEVLLLISGTAEDTPLLDMDTAESLSPIQAWVAIADEPTTVPQRLLERATPAELALLADPDQVDSLRADVRQKLDHATQIQAQPLEPHAYGTCTATQISTARSVFGLGYTSASTCGDALGFQNTVRDYWYCNAGDCDYPLATQEGSCIPAVNNNSAVKGRLAALTMRSKTAGNPTFVTGGAHRIRGFAYNCHGNGSINVHMDYGAGNWDTALASGYYVGAVWLGSDMLPAKAFAIHYVSYAGWDNGIGASGPNYQASEFSITGNAAAGDYGIFCSDAQKSLTMIAGPTGNQHSWCTGTCSVGNCWD
ncbi:hypothetical protein [Enhygromyxa salina]|uniref:hypothetical protein n=1 Tax=Enhygromyxa salina TaxID=215803 RepID=UPI0011B23A0B|nr:hypothetical protein [Enhygromyxa salina]